MHFASSHGLLVIILVWTQSFKQSQGFQALFSFSQCLQGLSVNSRQKQDMRIPVRDAWTTLQAGCLPFGLTDLGSSHSLWWEQFSLLLSGDAWVVFYALNHASGSFSLALCSLEGCQSSTAQGSCKAKSSEPSGRCSGILFSLKCRA